MVLTSMHWLFLFWVVMVVLVMGLRRDPLIPCLLGLFSIGWMFKGSLVGGLQTVFNALTVAGNEFLGIIVIISIIVAMSKMLTEIGADYLIMRPLAKMMVNADIAFWVLGIAMMITSWFVWPSPAMALIGAIMLPVAVRAGLPSMGAAMSMSLFGYGLGLGNDIIIQGAPSITAKAAGFTSPLPVMTAGIPLALVMGLVTTVTAYIMVKRDMKKNAAKNAEERLAYEQNNITLEIGPTAYIISILTPIAFVLDVVAMLALKLKGGDATALIGGTASIILILGCLLQYKMEGLEKITDFVRDGFMFGMKIFAPVLIIGGFFFLGKGELSQAILASKTAPGFLEDLGMYLSQHVPLSKAPIAIIEMLVGIVVGMDGSGFSPLPLVGSIAGTFGKAAAINTATLAALGQIAGVWTGGGTLIPWALIPVAAISGVNPIELARANFWPVTLGFIATTIAAIILM